MHVAFRRRCLTFSDIGQGVERIAFSFQELQGQRSPGIPPFLPFQAAGAVQEDVHVPDSGLVGQEGTARPAMHPGDIESDADPSARADGTAIGGGLSAGILQAGDQGEQAEERQER